MGFDYEQPDFYAKLAFSEADKSSMENFDKDAIAILSVANNRALNYKRFGTTMEQLYNKTQFNGVGSDEWNKVDSGKLTDKEKEYYKRALQLQYAVMNGNIPDPTGGADHYYNPKISKPDWGNMRTPDKGKNGTYYPKTYETNGHVYLKETFKKN